MHCKKMLDLEHEGQSNVVQHSTWQHSMTNANLYKSHMRAFFASSHRFRGIHISIFVTVKMLAFFSRSLSTIFLVTLIDAKYLTSYLMAIVMFVQANI